MVKGRETLKGFWLRLRLYNAEAESLKLSFGAVSVGAVSMW